MPKLPSVADLGARPDTRVGGGVSSLRPEAGVGDAQYASDQRGVESIMKLGQNMQAVAEKESEQLDLTRADDAFNQVRTKQLDLTYGAENGFTKVNGRDAVTRPMLKDWTERFDEEARGVEETLTTDRQRERFRKQVGIARASYQGDIMKYVAGESDRYQASVFQTTLDTETRNVGANPQDDLSAELSIARAAAAAEAESRRKGFNTPEEIANARSKATDHLWVSRLEAWRLKDPVGAMASFQTNQQSISPLVRTKLAEGLYRDAAPVLAAQLNEAGGAPVTATSIADGIVAPAVGQDGKPLPRGVRNNNPGNIIQGPTKWQGEIEGADPRYASFASPEDGIRALGKNLLVYGAKGIDSVSAIVARWAPATENETQSYIAAVSKKLGVNPTEPLNLKDRKVLTALAQSIIEHENGSNPYSPEQISTGIDAAVTGKELPGAKNRGPGFSVASLANMTPSDALKVTTGNAVVDALPPDQKLDVLHRARTQANQGMSQVRESLRGRIDDTVAAYERGLDAPNPPSQSELILAYGQLDGERAHSRIANARQFGQDVKAVANLPATQQAALLAGRQPKPGDGFADAERRHEQLAKAIDQVAKQREQDPSLAVLRNSPQVQSAYTTFVDALTKGDVAGQTAAAQAYASATLAEQQRLEIRNPQILTKDMVDSIAKRFAEPAKDGQGVVNIMDGQVAQWGKYWPQVGAQLSKSLPAGAVVIGLGVKPEARAILSEALQLKPEQLRQGLQESDVKDIRDKVRTQFTPLKDSLAWQGGGQATYDNYADTSEILATALVQKGFKVKDAVEKAWESTIGFKYEFESTWRVPKEVLGGSTTINGLRAGAEAAKRDITDEKPVLGEAVKFLVPMGDRPTAARPEDLEKQWRETVRDNGFWVTSPGDGGLTLYVKSGLGAQPVLDISGQPIRRNWSELAGIGQSVRAATFADVQRRKP